MVEEGLAGIAIYLCGRFWVKRIQIIPQIITPTLRQLVGHKICRKDE